MRKRETIGLTGLSMMSLSMMLTGTASAAIIGGDEAAVQAVIDSYVPDNSDAASVALGSFFGSGSGQADYLNVFESSPTGDDSPLWGTPASPYDGFNLVFPAPIGINANSVGGLADITDGRLSFMVEASTPGETIESITFQEAGLFSFLNAAGNGVAVQAGGTISFVDSNLNPVSIPFVLTGSTSSSTSIGLGISTTGGTFELATTVDLSQYETSKINVSFDNILTAVSSTNGFASIDKKDASISVVVVPEPGTLMLLTLGGTLLATARFRKA